MSEGKAQKKTCIYSKKDPEMRLRSTEQTDIELLRVWKNKNRSSFFYKEVISAEQQIAWFRQYLTREDDDIFIVEIMELGRWKRIGCIGCRKAGEVIDLYNVMRGEKTERRSSMREAMELLLDYLARRYDCPVKCDVLIDNPAVEWYNRCGFAVKEQIDGYYVMAYEGEEHHCLLAEGEI